MKTITIKNTTIGEGVPKIIVPLMAATEEQLLQEAESVTSLHPDIIEWRADVYEEVDRLEAVAGMAAKLRKALPDTLLLFTFRSHKEGGNKEIEDSYYIELLKTVIGTKQIDLVDVELFYDESDVKSVVKTAENNGVYVIMSNHDFHQTPEKEEIIARLRKMQEYGAHIPKIAVMPQTTEDLLVLLDATHTMKTKYADRPLITMSMAGTGLVSRLAGEIFGSACTFGAGKEASAPGQIPVPELRDVLNILHKNL
ncbi:type I 3-dehydroquinate dehydratase [Bacillus atrophaeus]|uniref:type I 3-dehydroquinate dehydratase n=1 Tax=Bacillus atrophaeus TaxID=1452 RepID=UPI00032EBB26|nr:type I 3-dehydroquinate dehydratase [Bacillus atrophaeus]AKL83502.1 AroD [Bacillus atrophaeus UCMB-5137]ATO29913.1 type I 3-dehydroquinate dehydratase [Bacillus atrophaeus]MEC0697477.1 type I 3-dehydroquinate dehydratase [Bacillus atrophaeus]WFE14961.1 type I 3-dehydroquinate dehydratase [Bacillus atrophaeus]WNV80560.1 type I 3-dehydroquinate dehydratase [Bacillus atrophaeus]